MNNIYMKKKYSKRAKGFSKLTNNTRISRSQMKQLSNAYDMIINELSIHNRDKLNKTMGKFQTRFREKLKSKKSKTKKVSKYKSSEYYKTLEEIPPPLLNKILSNIYENFELKDDEAKNLLIKTILASGVSNVFNKSLDNIFQLNEIILKYCKEGIKYLKQIQNNSNYPSSADEEEREIIDSTFRPIIQNLRNKMMDVFYNLNRLLVMRDEIVIQLNNILKVINEKDEDEDSKIFRNFIDIINIDYDEEFDKAESYRNNSTYALNLKIDNLKKELPDNIEKVKKCFERLLKTKLIFSKTDDTTMYTHRGKNYSIINIINNFINAINITLVDFEKFLESKKKSQSKRISNTRTTSNQR